MSPDIFSLSINKIILEIRLQKIYHQEKKLFKRFILLKFHKNVIGNQFSHLYHKTHGAALLFMWIQSPVEIVLLNTRFSDFVWKWVQWRPDCRPFLERAAQSMFEIWNWFGQILNGCHCDQRQTKIKIGRGQRKSCLLFR